MLENLLEALKIERPDLVGVYAVEYFFDVNKKPILENIEKFKEKTGATVVTGTALTRTSGYIIYKNKKYYFA
jgi:hypothetical protein